MDKGLVKAALASLAHHCKHKYEKTTSYSMGGKIKTHHMCLECRTSWWTSE